LVGALRYKPESRGFDSPWGQWKFFIDIILPAALLALGSTQPLTEMSASRPVRRADNLTTFMCRLSSNPGFLTSWNPRVLSSPVQGLFYLYLYQYLYLSILLRDILMYTEFRIKYILVPMYVAQDPGLNYLGLFNDAASA
jgi:hypothetical protein